MTMTKKPAKNFPSVKINCKKTFGFDCDFEVLGFEEAENLVPQIDENYVFDEATSKVILAALIYNQKTLIQGMHGTGKSTHIEQVCARLNWQVLRVTFDSQKKRLSINVDFVKGALFKYKDEKTGETKEYKAYDTVEKTWRHLNFFEHECYLIVRTPRIKPDGGGIKLIMPPWSGVVAGFTMLFEALILELCQHSPVSQVGKILNLSDRKLWHLLDCYVFKGLLQADHSALKMIGMDETSLKKGHEYISLFVDLEEKKTIHIEAGKDHKTVLNFSTVFESNQGKKENVTDISCDMSPAFIKGVKFHYVHTVDEVLAKAIMKK